MAQQYPNRTDLRNPMSKAKFTGQGYGQATQQAQSQAAVPAGPSPTDTIQPAGPMPGQVTDLTGTSQRPNEPISMGMPFGAGPGPEVFGPTMRSTQPIPTDILGGSRQYTIDQVRNLYSRHPNSALFQLILELENQKI
jgi:hypothetical protein